MYRTSFLAALTACALAAPAQAQKGPQTSTQQVRTIAVGFDDLDLSRDADARVLLVRIERASRDICGDRPAPRLVAANVRHQSCIRSTVSSSVAHVNSPRLTALLGDEAKPVWLAAR